MGEYLSYFFLGLFFLCNKIDCAKKEPALMLTRNQAHNQGVTIDQAMSTYIDSHRRTRRDQGDQQPPKGGNVAPPPIPDGAADAHPGDLAPPSRNPVLTTTTTTTTVQQQPTSTPQANPATSGTSQQSAPAIETEDDDEAFSDSDGNSESDGEDFQIPTKSDVAGFLGLPKESGPIGLAKVVSEMSVEEAVERYALPPEHLEELRKTVSNKLAQVPWPRRVPRNALGYGKRQVDDLLVKQEESIRLMMALMMADQPDIAMAVGLSSLVSVEKQRADRVRWAVQTEVPESTPEPLRMFLPEEQAAINRKIAMARPNPRRGKFFRGTTKASQGRQQQTTTTSQQIQRGRSRSQAPKSEGQGKPAPNGQGPRRL